MRQRTGRLSAGRDPQEVDMDPLGTRPAPQRRRMRRKHATLLKCFRKDSWLSGLIFTHSTCLGSENRGQIFLMPINNNWDHFWPILEFCYHHGGGCDAAGGIWTSFRTFIQTYALWLMRSKIFFFQQLDTWISSDSSFVASFEDDRFGRSPL